ncbi:MAG: hypothetical protein ACFCUG_04950 [Thiotrichales bacterium]
MLSWDLATFNAWSVALGIGCIIAFKIYVITILMREAKEGNLGALVLAAVLGFGLLSVIAGVLVWWILSRAT